MRPSLHPDSKNSLPEQATPEALCFTPFIPAYLIPPDGVLETTFLGQIPVTYLAEDLLDLCPGVTKAARYTLI